MAEHIHVSRTGDDTGIYIDNVLLPWFTAPGWDIHIDRATSPGVTVTILAKRITVDHDIGGWQKPDEGL